MPFLDANALTDDADGLAFLGKVLGTRDSKELTVDRSRAFERDATPAPSPAPEPACTWTLSEPSVATELLSA